MCGTGKAGEDMRTIMGITRTGIMMIMMNVMIVQLMVYSCDKGTRKENTT